MTPIKFIGICWALSSLGWVGMGVYEGILDDATNSAFDLAMAALSLFMCIVIFDQVKRR